MNPKFNINIIALCSMFAARRLSVSIFCHLPRTTYLDWTESLSRCAPMQTELLAGYWPLYVSLVRTSPVNHLKVFSVLLRHRSQSGSL